MKAAILIVLPTEQKAAKEAEDTPLEELVKTEPITGLPILPHWLAQPYFRPQQIAAPAPVEAKKKQPTLAPIPAQPATEAPPQLIDIPDALLLLNNAAVGTGVTGKRPHSPHGHIPDSDSLLDGGIETSKRVKLASPEVIVN